MLHRVRLPTAYVVARASIADGGQWVSDVMRTCSRAVSDPRSIDLIDEEQIDETGGLAGAVLKISESLSTEALVHLSKEIQAICPQGVALSLVKGLAPAQWSLDPQHLSVEYFRREFASSSSRVCHTDSCVRLTHRPTGRSARSTGHRSRFLNHEEALFLLESLVRSDADVPSPGDPADRFRSE